MKFKPFYLRVSLYFIIIIAVFAMQSANFLPEIYGYSYNLLPTIAIALAILASVYEAVIFTFLITFLCDFNFAYVQGLNSIYFVSAVIIISFVTEKYFTKSFVTDMLFVCITLLIQKLFQCAYYYLIIDRTDFLLHFQFSCAEVLIATLLCPITYAFIYFISSILKDGE